MLDMKLPQSRCKHSVLTKCTRSSTMLELITMTNTDYHNETAFYHFYSVIDQVDSSKCCVCDNSQDDAGRSLVICFLLHGSHGTFDQFG